MQIYILDHEYEMLGVIDEQEDIVFNKQFNDVGYCALKVACSAEMLSLLRRGHYIYRYDDDIFCKIEKVSLDTDVENGDYLTVDATDMNKILAGRIVRRDVTYSGTVLGFIELLINENVINPAQDYRKIANFTLYEMTAAERAAFTETISVAKDTATKDLLPLIRTTCKSYNYGFRVSFNIQTRKLVFRVFKGKNKAETESAEYVEFSPNYANIIASHYAEDESNYKNVAYVGYKSADKDDENVYLLSLYEGETEPQGEERRELYIDGTSTSREIDYSTLRTIVNASIYRNPATVGTETSGYYYTRINGQEQKVATFEITTDDKGVKTEKITVTDYTYLLLIRTVGKNALAERTKTQEFDGAVDTIDTYLYKTDYNLGDIVKVANDYGITAAAQITEVTESESAEQPYLVEPKFEFIY